MNPSAENKNLPHIEIQNLARSFDGRKVLDGVSFKVKRGETVVILGGSGCGKSTLLRHIIGSLKPDLGKIWLMGKEITGMGEEEFSFCVCIKPRATVKRALNQMTFLYSLLVWPWKSVPGGRVRSPWGILRHFNGEK